jgi:hypothetical protein
MTSASERDNYFEERFVAFVDILGFWHLVGRMKKDRRLFTTIRDALNIIGNQSRQFRQYRAQRGESDLRMTAFSDCYVVSGRISAWRVLAGVQALGATLLSQGILCRGAVVKGAAYHRGRVLFGPAVIEAYKLENRVAKYPRILVIEAVLKNAWNYHKGSHRRGRLFTQDTDGCWFVNVLTPSMSKWSAVSPLRADVSSRKFLQTARRQIKSNLEKARNDLGQLSKLHWLGHHFNKIALQRGSVKLLDLPADCGDRSISKDS